MGDLDHLSDDEIRQMDTKELRKAAPSGWMRLSRYETVVLAIDALIESPPSKEFSQEELSERAGVTVKSLRKYVDDLVELGVIEEGGTDADPQYSLNETNPITQQLLELNVTVQRVLEGDLPHSLEESPRRQFDRETLNQVHDTPPRKTRRESDLAAVAQ